MMKRLFLFRLSNAADRPGQKLETKESANISTVRQLNSIPILSKLGFQMLEYSKLEPLPCRIL